MLSTEWRWMAELSLQATAVKSVLQRYIPAPYKVVSALCSVSCSFHFILLLLFLSQITSACLGWGMKHTFTPASPFRVVVVAGHFLDSWPILFLGNSHFKDNQSYFMCLFFLPCQTQCLGRHKCLCWPSTSLACLWPYSTFMTALGWCNAHVSAQWAIWTAPSLISEMDIKLLCDWKARKHSCSECRQLVLSALTWIWEFKQMLCFIQRAAGPFTSSSPEHFLGKFPDLSSRSTLQSTLPTLVVSSFSQTECRESHWCHLHLLLSTILQSLILFLFSPFLPPSLMLPPSPTSPF